MRFLPLLALLLFLACESGVSDTANAGVAPTPVANNAAGEVTVFPPADWIDGKEIEARKSPMAVASALKGDAYVKVVYNQPHMRGREMLGKELPYGKLWRFGANEATELFTTQPIKLAGQSLPAGAYSLFAMPEANQWTLIVNKALGEWGAYNYDEADDVARLPQPLQKADKTYEAFTLWFAPDGSSLNAAWGEQQASWPVEL